MKLFFKVLLVGICIVFIGIAALSYYLINAGGIERLTISQINKLLGEDSRFIVSLGSIGGNFYSGISVDDLSVRYSDSDISFTLLQVPRVTADYSIMNLIDADYRFNLISLDSPIVELHRDSSGRFIGLASLNQRPDSAPKGTPAIVISDFRLKNAFVSLIDPADSLTIYDLNLNAELLTEGGTYTGNIRELYFKSNRPGLELTDAGGKLTVAEKNIVFKDLRLVQNESRVKLDGALALGSMSGNVTLDANNLNLAELSPLIRANLKGIIDLTGDIELDSGSIRGSLSLGGKFQKVDLENLMIDFRYANKHLTLDTVYGTILGSTAVDGRGEVDFSKSDKEYSVSAYVSNFNLQSLISSSFVSDLNGQIELSGRSFKTSELELSITVDIHESSFDNYPIHYTSGDMVVTADSILFVEGFQVNFYENEFVVGGKVEYRDEIDLRVDARLGSLERWKDKFFLKDIGGRAEGNVWFTGETKNPNISGVLRSDSIRVYGLLTDSLTSEFKILRMLTAPAGTVQFNTASGSLWALAFDSSSGLLEVDSGSVHFDSLDLYLPSVAFSAGGNVQFEGQQKRITVDNFQTVLFDRTLHNRSPLVFEADDKGFDFRRFTVGDTLSELTVTGRLNFNESLDLRLSIAYLPLEHWLSLLKREIPLSGNLTSEASVRGSFNNPIISLYASVDSMVYNQHYVGMTTLSAIYENNLVTLDTFKIESSPGDLVANGTFSADLSLRNGVEERLLDRPIDLTVRASQNNFDLLLLALPSIEEMGGDFSAQFKLSGTPNDPHLQGKALLKNGWLKYLDLVDTLYFDSSLIEMVNNQVVLDDVSFYIKNPRHKNRKSYVDLDGSLNVLTLDSLYLDINVSLPREVPFRYELEEIDGVVEGDLHIEGFLPPKVTGDLQILSAMYRVNFADANQGSPLMSALSSGDRSWDFDLNIEIISNYWIKNDDIDAEFSGNVNIIRTNGSDRLLGEMEILRGKAYLFDKTFQLEPGGTVAFTGSEALNPNLDIVACTRIPGQRLDSAESSEQLELCIHVTGTLENPEINPAEDSPFNREDIFPLLVANYYAGDSTRAQNNIEQRISTIVSNQFSQLGTRRLGQLVGVETFEIDPTSSGSFDLRKTSVTLGFYTAPNLYVYGRSATTGQEVGFEYRFRKGFTFEGRRDDEDLYHVNLKLHWEY
ncbi:MAG: translocation/assembly module TamB domain-containing protein [candidate division Zixibacteria bacterium]|nr:translocation/assembly module TamB domain-containing protein [candidate division Zixibacteria bacterium]